MDSYNVNGGNNQIIGMGRKNKISGKFINYNYNYELNDIQKELGCMKSALLRKKSLNETEKQLLDEVNELVKIKDRDELIRGIISRASNLFYNYAMNITGGILASIIYNHL